MSDKGKEGLLERWSRLKRESTGGDEDGLLAERGAADTERVDAVAEVARRDVTPNSKPTKKVPETPDLPSIDELDPDSDFEAFMDPGVNDNVRRAALKTLFHDPDFNVTDGLDVYAEDYTKLEKLTPAMVAALRYAQRTLVGGTPERGVEVDQANEARVADVDKPAGAEPRHGEQRVEAITEGECNNSGLEQTEKSGSELESPPSETVHTKRNKN